MTIPEDPFRWLEDAADPAVKAWTAAQNRAAREHLARNPGRDAVRARLREMIYVDGVSPPIRRGDRWFFMRAPKDREKALLYVRQKDEPAEILLDPNVMSGDGSISLGVWVPSWDGERVAFTLSENAADESTLHLIDVASRGRSAIDVIPGAKYAHPSWLPDASGFFYTRLPVDPTIPAADRPGFAEVRFHRAGTDPSLDPLVHPCLQDPTRFLGAQSSRDGRWLFIVIWRGWSENDLYAQKLGPGGALEGDLLPVAVKRAARFELIAHEDRFYVLTNEGAPRGKVYALDPATCTDRASWREIIPEDPEAVIEAFSIAGGHIALDMMRSASSELSIHALDGARVRTVRLPALGTASGLIGNPEDDRAYFSFSSFTHPTEVHRTSIASGETELEVRVDIPGLDPDRFTIEQVRYPSRDKTLISMFVVHDRRLKKDGSNPALLYGYGGFNISLTPSFSARVYAWLERGGLYAVPNLRGGGEYGESWHRAGMLESKQNTFDDFLAAAEWLIANGYTSPRRLAIEGHSNGGLLAGAAMTQRPDLFRAVIAGVPLADMVRYHLVGSGKTWIPEYGSADDPEQLETLLAYSPVHRVRDGVRYPALLVLSADTDDRVDPMHARKLIARVQQASNGEGKTLLRIEERAGHGGADLRRAAVEQAVDVLSFLFDELGVG